MTVVTQPSSHVDPYSPNLDLDVLIVGAGFSGIYLLYQLRKKGYNVKIFDLADGLGGTWRVNHYPGARVDSHIPVYEFSIPELWRDWSWKQLYPSVDELRAYFEHCDKILDIKKDVAFKTTVVEAKFDTTVGKWTIKTDDGRITKAKYFLPCIGFAAATYVPDFPGLETFKGEIHHSSKWPETPVNVSGKKVAVIGTGATGVQIIQEWGKEAKSLVVFQRTPNMCLPMGQRQLTPEGQNEDKKQYPDIYKRRLKTRGGLLTVGLERDTFDDSPEEQQRVFENLWKKGGFALWTGGYQDMLTNLRANRVMYEFWAKKIRELVVDPRKRELLAPEVQVR